MSLSIQFILLNTYYNKTIISYYEIKNLESTLQFQLLTSQRSVCDQISDSYLKYLRSVFVFIFVPLIIIMEELEDNPRKVKKYKTKFKDSWLTNEKYMKWLVKINDKKPKCSFCNVYFTVK